MMRAVLAEVLERFAEDPDTFVKEAKRLSRKIERRLKSVKFKTELARSAARVIARRIRRPR